MSHATIDGKLASYQIIYSGVADPAYSPYPPYPKEGQIHISVWHEKRFIPMVSVRNPEREADRLLGNFTLKDGLIAIVFGAAALPLINILLKHQENYGGFLIVFEADTKLADSLQDQFSGLNNFLLITPDNISLLHDSLETLAVENFLGYRIFKSGSSVKLAEDLYANFESTLKRILASRLSDLFTRLEFESTWVYNSLSQTCLLAKAQPVRRLFNTMKGHHALLVSSGPSLRQSLPIIKKQQQSMFIAVVDSAYRVLHRYGIKPDLIISLDSQPYTLKHFQGLSWGSKDSLPLLYADLVANPQVTMRWQGPLFFGVTAQYSDDFKTRVVTPGSDFVEDNFVDQPKGKAQEPKGKGKGNDRARGHGQEQGLGDIQSGGSVATSLFDLLRQMAFESITLVGQDLAYSNREIHTMGTHHCDVWLSNNISRISTLENINNAIIKKRHTTMVQSKQGKKIHSDYVLALYRDWFQDAIDSINAVDLKVFNATIEGLPMKGNTKESPLKNTINKDFSFLLKHNEVNEANKVASAIAAFYEKLQNSSLDQLMNLPFMQFIARKKTIQAKRTASLDDKTKELIEKEKKRFIAKLKDSLPLWRGLIEIDYTSI